MKMIFSVALISLLAASVNAQTTIKGDVNGDGSVDVSDITTVASIILNPTPDYSPIMGKWKEKYDAYFEFASNDRGFYYKPAEGEYRPERYEPFIYKFNKSTGKITCMFGDEFEGSLFKDSRVIVDGTVYAKVSTSSESYPKNTVIGEWNTNSGKCLSFNNYTIGEYRNAEGDYVSFTYSFNESANIIILTIDDTQSTAKVNGSTITYEGETYNIGSIPENDAVLGAWWNGDNEIYFKDETSGYYAPYNASEKEFDYTFNPETGIITLYFQKSRETAELIIDSNGMYILYNSTKFYL